MLFFGVLVFSRLKKVSVLNPEPTPVWYVMPFPASQPDALDGDDASAWRRCFSLGLRGWRDGNAEAGSSFTARCPHRSNCLRSAVPKPTVCRVPAASPRGVGSSRPARGGSWGTHRPPTSPPPPSAAARPRVHVSGQGKREGGSLGPRQGLERGRARGTTPFRRWRTAGAGRAERRCRKRPTERCAAPDTLAPCLRARGTHLPPAPAGHSEHVGLQPARAGKILGGEGEFGFLSVWGVSAEQGVRWLWWRFLLIWWFVRIFWLGSEVSNLARKEQQELEQVSGRPGSGCSSTKSPGWVFAEYSMEEFSKGLFPVAGGLMSLNVSACVSGQWLGFYMWQKSAALIPQVFYLSCFLTSEGVLPKLGLSTFRHRGRKQAYCRYLSGLQGPTKCSRLSATKPFWVCCTSSLCLKWPWPPAAKWSVRSEPSVGMVAKPHVVWTYQGGQWYKDLRIMSVVLHFISSLPKSLTAIQWPEAGWSPPPHTHTHLQTINDLKLSWHFVGAFNAWVIIWQCMRRELGREGVEELCCPVVIRCGSSRKPEENTEVVF